MKAGFKKTGMGLALTLLTGLAALSVCEWYLRKFDPRMLEMPLPEEIELTRQTLKLVQTQNHMMRLNDPRLHHGLYPDTHIQGNREGHPFDAHTNSQGFRNAFPFSKNKTPGTIRIAVTGDSFTFGTYVDDSETYPVQIQKSLEQKDPSRKWEVYNFGVPSYSPLIYWQQYLQIIRDYHPDFLIVAIDNSDMRDDFYYEQDTEFDSTGFVTRFLNRYYAFFMGDVAELRLRQRVQNLEARQASLSNRLQAWGLSHLQLAARLRDASQESPPQPGKIENDLMGHFRGGEDWTPHWKRSSGYLHKLLEAARQDGTPVWFCHYPYPHQVHENAWPGRTQHGFRTGMIHDTPLRGWIREFSETEKVPFLDLTDSFRKSGIQNFSFQNDLHYLPEGYRLMGQTLADWIIKNHPSTPSPISPP